jgi:hypothetical protein
MKQKHFNFIIVASLLLTWIVSCDNKNQEYIYHKQADILWHCYRVGYDRLTVTNLNLAYPTINVIDTNQTRKLAP